MKNRVGFVVGCCLMASSVVAQYTSSDPLTRLGLGDRMLNGNAGLQSMGGAAFVAVDPQVFQINNPATYAWVKETAFQTSASVNRSRILQNSVSNDFYGGNVGEIAMGFRKTGNPWGFALGLSDYTRVGYAVDAPFSVNDSIYGTRHQYGNGGLHQLTIGGARKFLIFKDSASVVGHQVSIGVNLQYQFGMITHNRDLEFLNTNVYNSRFVHEMRVNDVRWDIGAWYQFPLLGNRKSGNAHGMALGNIGVTCSPGSSMHAFTNDFGVNYYMYGGVPVTIDTGFANMEVRRELKIPLQWSVSGGVSYWMKKGGYLGLAYSTTQQDWSGVNNSSIGWEELNGLKRYSAQTISLEWLPQSPDRSQFFLGLIRYRAGVTQVQDYIATSGVAASKRIYSAGMSIPIRSSKSNTTIQIGYQWRTRNTGGENSLRSEAHAICLGVQLHPFERWFIQRKYD